MIALSLALSLAPLLSAQAAPRSLTVLVCDRASGCPDERAALQADAARRGLSWLDLPTFLAEIDATATAEWVRSLSALEADPTPARAAQAAAALRDTPALVGQDALLRYWLAVAVAEGGGGRPAEAALDRALSASGERVHDLPPLDEATRARLLDRAEARRALAPATLRVQAPAPATVWVDGRRVGELVDAGALAVEVRPGWHRLAVTRPGLPAARAVDVEAGPGQTLPLTLRAPPGEGALVRAAALVAVMGGQPADPDHTRELARRARAGGWDAVRFVDLRRAYGDVPPEEVVRGPTGQAWAARSLWLDARTGQLVGATPPARVRPKREGERVRVGGGLGYARLGDRDHLGVDLVVGLPLGPPALNAELRLGALRANDPYYLYADWVDPHVFPVSLGLRVGPPQGGVYGRAAAVAVAPVALGGEAALGWELALTPGLRLQVEGAGGWTDQGLLARGWMSVVARR